jgi:hypothetical protein
VTLGRVNDFSDEHPENVEWPTASEEDRGRNTTVTRASQPEKLSSPTEITQHGIEIDRIDAPPKARSEMDLTGTSSPPKRTFASYSS